MTHPGKELAINLAVSRFSLRQRIRRVLQVQNERQREQKKGRKHVFNFMRHFISPPSAIPKD